MADSPFRILLLGEAGVGKTSIIKRYCIPHYQLQRNEDHETVNVDFIEKKIRLNPNWDRESTLLFIDTRGIERGGSVNIPSSMMRNLNGLVLVYDASREETMRQLNNWNMRYFSNQDRIPLLVLANKKDRKYPTENQISFINKNIQPNLFCYTDASSHRLEDTGINEAFSQFGNLVLDHRNLLMANASVASDDRTNSIILDHTPDVQPKKQSICGYCSYP